MKKGILIFIIGIMLGIEIFTYQFYTANKEQIIFNFTGELLIKFEKPAEATKRCDKMGGISIGFNMDTKEAICYKWKQL